MKKNFSVVLIFLLPFFSFSQTFTYYDTLNGASSFIGENDTAFFVQTMNVMSGFYKIHCYNKQTMKRTRTFNCDIQDKKEGRMNFTSAIIIDGKLTYLTFQGKTFSKKSIARFAQPFNENKMFFIDTVYREKGQYLFTEMIKLNKDSLLLYSYSLPIEMYVQPKAERETKCTGTIYNKKFNKIKSGLEYTKGEIDDWQSGKINFPDKLSQPKLSALDHCRYQKINYEFINPKNQWKVYGLFWADTSGGRSFADGYFEYLFDGKYGQLISKEANLFSGDAVTKLRPEMDRTLFGKVRDNILVRDNFTFSNSSYISIYYIYEGGTGANNSQMDIFKDIYVIAVDKAGNFLWQNRINRYVRYEGESSTGFMNILHGDSQACIFYYSTEKGKKTFLYSFDADGKMSEEEIDSEYKNLLNTSNYYRTNNNEYLGTMNIKGEKYVIVKITFNK